MKVYVVFKDDLKKDFDDVTSRKPEANAVIIRQGYLTTIIPLASVRIIQVAERR
jgi:hypothetical protein